MLLVHKILDKKKNDFYALACFLCHGTTFHVFTIIIRQVIVCRTPQAMRGQAVVLWGDLGWSCFPPSIETAFSLRWTKTQQEMVVKKFSNFSIGFKRFKFLTR